MSSVKLLLNLLEIEKKRHWETLESLVKEELSEDLKAEIARHNKERASILDLINTQEPKKQAKTIRKHAFEKSPIYDRREFDRVFSSWYNQKQDYYYKAAMDWSTNSGGRYITWVGAIKTWEQRDRKSGTGYYRFRKITGTMPKQPGAREYLSSIPKVAD